MYVLMDKAHPQDNQDELKDKIISSLTNRGNHIYSALVRNMTHVDTKLTEKVGESRDLSK